MPLNPEILLNWPFEPVDHVVTERDCKLYALSIGLGSDPLDTEQLRFVAERDFAVFPTMPVVIGHPGDWQEDPRSGVTQAMVVHGEQDLVLHGPLVPNRTVRSTSRITGVVDKGASRGALIYLQRNIVDVDTGAPIATALSTVFCRADGGFDGSTERRAGVAPVPRREPDQIVMLPTLPQSALLYRLNGDYNPLHSDPARAHVVGYERPILHGLCTYGMAGHAVLKAYCAYRPDCLQALTARFTAPVFPGETISFALWRDDKAIAFRASVEHRGAIVLIGHASLAVSG